MTEFANEYPVISGIAAVVLSLLWCWLIFKGMELHDQDRGRS